MLPSLFSSGGFAGAAGAAGAGFVAGAGVAAGFGFAVAAPGSGCRLSAGFAGVAGAGTAVSSYWRCAALQSAQRNLPVFLPVVLSWAMACLPQSGCSQFAHFVIESWPHGFLRSKPVSTVQVSTTLP